MNTGVVITGMGLVTPLGRNAGVVMERVLRGDRVNEHPSFDTSAFYCSICAPVADFDAEYYFPDNKTLRFMNRDAQMAVVAARLALEDAALEVGRTYSAENIALFGATGLTGLPVDDITRLVRSSAASDGSFDPESFGRVALKRVRPVLSFKILANMPICFVSIFTNVRGENAVYTPWEGQGARAIAAGVRAIRQGRASCALVGGCDVKTHEFSFISLQQLGVFDSWRMHGRGPIPGEGAAFIVLEDEAQARTRNARIYARIKDFRFRTAVEQSLLAECLAELIGGLELNAVSLIAAGDGDIYLSESETWACERAKFRPVLAAHPKSCLGNLYAAAAVVQVGLAAELIRRKNTVGNVLANCFGFGSEQAAFVLEAP